jgi:hypothetical protein
MMMRCRLMIAWLVVPCLRSKVIVKDGDDKAGTKLGYMLCDARKSGGRRESFLCAGSGLAGATRKSGQRDPSLEFPNCLAAPRSLGWRAAEG